MRDRTRSAEALLRLELCCCPDIAEGKGTTGGMNLFQPRSGVAQRQPSSHSISYLLSSPWWVLSSCGLEEEGQRKKAIPPFILSFVPHLREAEFITRYIC